MKKGHFLTILVLALLAVAGFLVYKSATDERSIQACLESTRLTQKEAEKRRLENTENRNQQFGHKLLYFEDTRTGFCFAFVWVGMANGGPAMSKVECTEKVRELLNNTISPY